ncbi:MAG: DUF1330 domain-containing protein [Betaproteobacteria bacterium]
MPAYLIGQIAVRDAAPWQQYVDRVGATFAPHGGRVLFRATAALALNGALPGERVVVAEFPDLDALRRWHDSPEYQALIPLRDAGADVVLTAYEAT